MVLLAACSADSGSLPDEGPNQVVERFYDYISEAKLMGGGAPVREAFKLISADTSRLNQAQFMEIIKMYPPGFQVELTGSEINGSQALVMIVYKLPSVFGEHNVNGVVALNLDPSSNSWKIDFTGESYGSVRSDFVAGGRG